MADEDVEATGAFPIVGTANDSRLLPPPLEEIDDVAEEVRLRGSKGELGSDVEEVDF